MTDPNWLAKMSRNMREYNISGRQGHPVIAHICQAMTQCHVELNITMMLVATALLMMVGSAPFLLSLARDPSCAPEPPCPYPAGPVPIQLTHL